MSERATRVIGLAGGIGAGKSAVAAILRELGCVVSDSDTRAKELLDAPHVRDELVRWWGGSVLGVAGRVDRSAVASIVFADPDQRRRLEGLVHPLLKRERDAAASEAARHGARAFIIDAPLLFEAGLDAECDAVLFVEAPEAARLARVRATRGWSEAELRRREAAQWPLDRKRGLATMVVPNDGDPSLLRQRVQAALEDLLARPPRRPGGGG